jgi:selenocysteine lyase/cysteine desulfurase
MSACYWPSRFPAVDQEVNGHPLTYLDSAATTLRPQSVIDAIVEYYSRDNANPAKVHQLASRASERLSAARAAVAQFIGATDPLEVIFVRGTTEGINLIATAGATANLREGDELVISVAEHYSNLLPWTRAAERAGAVVRVASVDDEGRLTPEHLHAVLSPRTKLVAFSHVSNVLGYVNPVRELTSAAKSVGAVVVVDGAQAAPHVAIDVHAIGCDFYVFSGHKMLGPMATGVVWGRCERLEQMPPFHVGSNMAHNVSISGAEFERGALKYQAGTPDVAGPVGLHAAISFLQQAGRELARRAGPAAHWAHQPGAPHPGLHLYSPRTVSGLNRGRARSGRHCRESRRHGGVAAARAFRRFRGRSRLGLRVHDTCGDRSARLRSPATCWRVMRQKRSARKGSGSKRGDSPLISCASSRPVPGAVLSPAI